MGIPGLTSAVASYQQRITADFLAGGDFYVDGCNFVHANEDMFSEDGFINTFRQNLELLRSFKPNSITFYADSAFPLSKIQTRVSRHAQKLRSSRNQWGSGFCLVDHALEELSKNHKDIKVVMTGTEAEDYIFHEIKQLHLPLTRKTLVFSSDSDCFTFDMPQSDLIYIVPTRDTDGWPGTLLCYNLERVTRSGHVQRYLHPPPEPQGYTEINPKFPDRICHEFANTWQVHHVGISLMPIMPISTEPDVWANGQEWRKAGFAAIMGEDGIVDEYRQLSTKVSLVQVNVSTKLIDKYRQKLKKDIVDIVVDEMELHFKKPLPSLRSYLEDLKAQDDAKIYAQPTVKEQNIEFDECRNICSCTLALLVSIRIFQVAVRGDLEQHLLIWKINPIDLYRASREPLK